MQRPIDRRAISLGALALGCLVLVAAGSFLAGRALSDEDAATATDSTPAPAPAVQDATATPIPIFPGNEITPPPDATPDMTQPFWWVPFVNADRMSPKFTGEIAGITIDPQALFGPTCGSRQEAATDDEAAASPLALNLTVLPEGSIVFQRQIAKCDGKLLYNTFDYDLELDPPVAGQGGHFRVSRWTGPAGASFAFPEARWTEREIAGRPAAVAEPVLPTGVGESVVLVYEDGVMTMVYGSWMPLDDIIAIAEGLYE